MKYIILCMLWSCATYGQLYFDESSGVQHVLIDNFKGDITVRPSTDRKITIKVKNSAYNSLKSLKLKELRQGDLIAVYVDNPCKTNITIFDPSDPFHFIRTENNCQWDGWDEERIPDLSFEVEIPADMNIYVSTIMDGFIKVNAINGTVHAANVNGTISLDEVSRVTNGTTVNGDVTVNYKGKPTVTGRFSTINGDINLNVPGDASVTTKFKSYSGELYTDLDATMVDPKIENNENLAAGEMAMFGEYSEAKIGSGNVALYIETFSGNAYLKKNK